VDDRYDRDHASDGFSRYGAYLAERLDRALADNDLDDPAAWTAWCWRVATPPVMGPSYVHARDPLQGATFWRDPDSDGLAATVVAAAPLAGGISRTWRPWHRDLSGRLDHGLMPRALTRIEFEAVLDESAAGGWTPPPAMPCSRRDLVVSAKRAVRASATALNQRLGPDLAVLADQLGLRRARHPGLCLR
jgi:hypothetical protein